MTVEPRTSIVWEYAPAPEATDHLRLAERYGLFIGGSFCEPAEARVRADDQPGDRGADRRDRLGGPARRRSARSRSRGLRSPAGLRYRTANAASTCSGSRG